MRKKLERPSAARRKLDIELDRLEAKLEELRIQYEQYFVDVLPQPPEPLQREVVKLIKQLRKAPFKNSAIRFRLVSLVYRYQTYHTYWTRVLKQREDGTYVRDVFKAELHRRLLEEAHLANSAAGVVEKGFRQLFDTYQRSLRQVGTNADGLNYEAFKKSLVKKARQLKQDQGVKELQYKIIVRDGKVLIKATGKS